VKSKIKSKSNFRCFSQFYFFVTGIWFLSDIDQILDLFISFFLRERKEMNYACTATILFIFSLRIQIADQ
jgi:hypothetical protein